MNPTVSHQSQIILGDCIHVLAGMPEKCVDAVIADPPYLVKYRTRDGRRAYPNDDNPWWIYPAFREIYRVLKPDSFCISFYGWSKAQHFLLAWRRAGFYPIGHMVWVKRYASR